MFSLPRVLMSRQELRTSDPKMKLQCLIMEGSSSRIEPFADLLSLSLSHHSASIRPWTQPCQGHTGALPISISVAFSQKPKLRPPTHVPASTHLTLLLRLPLSPPPPPRLCWTCLHSCFSSLGTTYRPHPGPDQNLILEKWATWEQYTSVLFTTRGWLLRNLQNPLQNGNAEPLVQKLLRISRWHQPSVKA